MVNKSKKRFWEIDFLRGIAIIMMIIFHFLYDLNYFNILSLILYKGYFLIYVYIIGILFFTLVGISLTLSFNKAKKILSKKELKFKFFYRGIKILCLGLFITFISYLILDEGFIVFGVLHCIGVSIILAYPFLNLKYFNILFGLIFIFFGLILKNITFDFYWLLWLGLKPDVFYTIDYFPLLPWFGIILVGIFLGKEFYKENNRRFNLIDLSSNKFIKIFLFLGKHSLVIYFIHQPILLLLIYFSLIL